MTRTRTLLLATAITLLLGGGLWPAAAGETESRADRAQRPLVWTEASDPVVLRANTLVRDVACSPGGTSCVAVGHRSDENGYLVPAVQRWDGSGWQAEGPPGGTGSLMVVDCSTPSDCVALEQPRWDGGQSRRLAVRSPSGWRRIEFGVATGDTEFTMVSCASPSSCLLTGPGRDVALFDGLTVRALPRTPVVAYALACPSASFCAAVSDSAFLEWNGTAWSTTALEGAGNLVDVDCWAEQHCLALTRDGGTASYVRSPGSTWRPVSTPPGRSYAEERGFASTGLSCVADGSCHQLRLLGPRRAPELALASWAAGSWVSHVLPEPEGIVLASDCRPGECVLMDQLFDYGGPVRASALHGSGGQWARRDMVNPLGVLAETYPHQATCAARTWCLVLGSTGPLGAPDAESYVVRGDGQGWREMPAALADQRDLDCWRPGRCVVAGSDGKRPRAALLRGGRWRVLPALSPSWLVAGTATGVGCAGERCVYTGHYRARKGAGTGVFVARRAAGSWHARRLGPLVPADTAFTGRPSIDCPTASRCVVVVSTRLPRERRATSYEAVLEDGHWRWRTIGRGFSLFELDCPDKRHCIAGGEEGRPGLIMARGDDGAWRRVGVGRKNAAFYSVSCPTSRECFAAGTGTRVRQLTRTRTGWRARATGPKDMTDIACSRPRACLAFDHDTTWSGR